MCVGVCWDVHEWCVCVCGVACCVCVEWGVEGGRGEVNISGTTLCCVLGLCCTMGLTLIVLF